MNAAPEINYIKDLGLEVHWPSKPTHIRCPMCFSRRPVSMLFRPTEYPCGYCEDTGVCSGFTIEEDGHIIVHKQKLYVVDGKAVFEPDIVIGEDLLTPTRYRDNKRFIQNINNLH